MRAPSSEELTRRYPEHRLLRGDHALTPTPANLAIWIVAGLATAGVIDRHFKWPEAVWAVCLAALQLVLGLLPWVDGSKAISKGLETWAPIHL